MFTQPGMRYCQAQALVHVLMKDKLFAAAGEREKNLVTQRLLEEVRGRMLEDIVLLETVRTLPTGKRAFKLRLKRSEFDMLIYDAETDTCEAYEVKHSLQIHPHQYHVLEDAEACEETERKYGKISRRCVLYRGANRELENGITYHNVEAYLKERCVLPAKPR